MYTKGITLYRALYLFINMINGSQCLHHSTPLRTPGNLELRNLERRGTSRLAFIIVGLAGLVRDIDAGHMCCCSHFCLLTMSATLSSSLSILIELKRLLGTPGIRNWSDLIEEWQED